MTTGWKGRMTRKAFVCYAGRRLVGAAILLFALLRVSAEPLLEWQWRNPSPQGNPLHGVASGNGVWVAVGEAGALLVSANGSDWSVNRSVTNDLYDVIFANGLFVAVGGTFSATWSFSGDIFTSPDGRVWTRRDSGTSQPLLGVTYGNGAFVAVSMRGAIAVSTNGLDWVPNNGGHGTAVAFGDGSFVAVDSSGSIQRSVDAREWTSQSSPTTRDLSGVTFGNGLFVAVGEDGTILHSHDGASWASAASGTEAYLRSVAGGAGRYVAVGDQGAVLTSLDGLVWTAETSGVSADLLSISYDGDQFVAVGDSGLILASADGVAWAQQTRSLTFEGLNDIVFANGRFVTVGDEGTVLVSTNGQEWLSVDSSTTNCLRAIAFGDGLFVAAGDKGTIATSTNGFQWTTQTVPGVDFVQDLAFGQGAFAGVGANMFLYSPDGKAWSADMGGAGLQAVAFGNGTFSAVGDRGFRFRSSTNGIDWLVGAQMFAVRLYAVAFGKGVFAAVGDSSSHNPFNILLYSADGLNWSFGGDLIDPSDQPGDQLYGVTFGGGSFLAVGEAGAVDFSNNGIAWTRAWSGTALDLHAVAYGNGSFVAVGADGVILQAEPVIRLNLTRSAMNAVVIDGMSGTYVVQRTLNCAEPMAWESIATVRVSSTPYSWTDPDSNPMSTTNHFYRVMRMPDAR